MIAAQRPLLIYNLVVCVALLAPLAVVIGVALNPVPFINFPPQGISLHWFSTVVDNSAFMSSLLLSIEIAALAMAVSLFIATPAAVALVRSRSPRARAVVRFASILPLTVPEVLVALGLLVLFDSQLHLGSGFVPILLGHVVISVPVAVQLLTASVARLDASLEHVAWTLGASKLRAFLTVTVPLMAPGVGGAALFVFILSFDNVNISLFLSAPGQVTLPIQMLQYLQYQPDPSVAAMSTMLIVAGTIIFALAIKLLGFRRPAGAEGRL